MADELDEYKVATFRAKRFSTPSFEKKGLKLGGDSISLVRSFDYLGTAANIILTTVIGKDHLKSGIDTTEPLEKLADLSRRIDMQGHDLPSDSGELPSKAETAKILVQAMTVFNENDDFGRFAIDTLKAAGDALGVGDLKLAASINKPSDKKGLGGGEGKG